MENDVERESSTTRMAQYMKDVGNMTLVKAEAG
jgi:hypothetical protein